MRLYTCLIILLLPVLAACPAVDEPDAAAGQSSGGDAAAAGLTDAAGAALDISLEPSPLEALAWDGAEHSLPLAEFCDLLISEGAGALLTRSDFSAFDYTLEAEASGDSAIPIGIWVLPEDETPVGFSAQLVAFGGGERMIFGFSAAWYADNFGVGLEDLDAQFRSLHEQHGGALKNYAYADPDLDISFFQFDFDNSAGGTWGSPYMTHKRFTMHGDIPAWNFYCIGIDAGATLATRRDFIAEAAHSEEAAALPELDPNRQPDALLLQAAADLPGLLQFAGIEPGSGQRRQDFTLRRLLRPTTIIESYNLVDAEGDPLLQLQVAERSQLLELSFIDNWLTSVGIEQAAFLARFEELRAAHEGWEGELREATDTAMQDSGVLLGDWELARRSFSLGGIAGSSSWSIRRMKGWSAENGAD